MPARAILKISYLCAVMMQLLSNAIVLYAAEFDDAADRSAASAFVRAEGNMTTYKSGMLTSNDTGVGNTYTLGAHVGTDRSFGVLYNVDSSVVTFGINKGKVATTWTDTIIRYRMGAFYLGGVIGSVALQVTAPESQDPTIDGKTPVDVNLDVVGTGYGGNGGFVLGFGRNNAWYLDATTVSIAAARDLEQTDVTFGSRLDLDTGISFFITRSVFDMMVGYRTRQYSIKVAESYAESLSATYLAFRLNSFF